jgi:antitoxin (DNA-binding transcriptional repressor) of toxin-antitoxin stability system
MKNMTISTKEIRNDLEGFLKRLKNGQTIQVLYRSKPLVTLAAKDDTDPYLAKNAGSPIAAKHSVKFVKSLPKRLPTFDPDKSFRELYDETQVV